MQKLLRNYCIKFKFERTMNGFVWFGLVSLFNGRLFNAKAIFKEEQ